MCWAIYPISHWTRISFAFQSSWLLFLLELWIQWNSGVKRISNKTFEQTNLFQSLAEFIKLFMVESFANIVLLFTCDSTFCIKNYSIPVPYTFSPCSSRKETQTSMKWLYIYTFFLVQRLKGTEKFDSSSSWIICRQQKITNWNNESTIRMQDVKNAFLSIAF